MAHIGPRDPSQSGSLSGSQDGSTSLRHFLSILSQVESLYVEHRVRDPSSFPVETTVWGFFVAGFTIVTDDLRDIATARFAALGLRSEYTYYELYTDDDRYDQVRACVQIDGAGTTSFYIENKLEESIEFPVPLPDPLASQNQGHPLQRNYLVYSAVNAGFVQMFFGREVEPDLARFTGVYDVFYRHNGIPTWGHYNFLTHTWVS